MRFFSLRPQLQNKLYIFSGLIFLLWLLMQILYVSLFLSPTILIFLSYLAALFTFRISPKITVAVGLFVILCSFPWILVGSRMHAEPFGVAGFLLLCIAFLQEAWKMRNS